MEPMLCNPRMIPAPNTCPRAPNAKTSAPVNPADKKGRVSRFAFQEQGFDARRIQERSRTSWILGHQSGIPVGERQCSLALHRSRFAIGSGCKSETSCHHERSDGCHHDHVLRRTDVSSHGVATHSPGNACRSTSSGLRQASHVRSRREVRGGHGETRIGRWKGARETRGFPNTAHVRQDPFGRGRSNRYP